MSVALTRNQLTPESKALLRKTVRGLRESLIAELKESAEQRYLLSLPATKAATTLDAASSERRRRLEAALDQAAQEDGGGKEARARAFEAAAKEAGATLLNRLVLLRHLEALGLSKPAVLTGGWMSKGYQEFQQVAPALCEDETQGMAPLLELLFAELAVALPGLFGDVGLTGLFKVPPSTLRHVIEALDQVPTEAWCDDLTLGWVYQFWNDPDREALDAKLNARGKIEPHEIASKTQMFTERYIVEWLLQNSMGPTWLAICKKNGWAAEAESTGVLGLLDSRRAEWRKQRETGTVAPDALMPTNGPLEEAWKYYVPQPMPVAVVEHAPHTIRDLKILDPACGSGHFLVVAFDLLADLYREEARHRGESWSDRQIAEWILENNLHGVDIDPRAVQIAAAALYLKARALARDADPHQVNLVAPLLKLATLAKSDAGLLKLEADIRQETGIPPELTRQIIEVLEGVDHLGSLLKLGDAVEKALAAHEGIFATTGKQKELFGGAVPTMPLDKVAAKLRVQQLLEGFLAARAGAEDLGLRLRGQQLTAGLRFASIAKEGEYHLVVGNPPYQGTSKMKNAKYVAKNYPMGKSDLYGAFLERGLQLCRPGGVSAMVTMRSWMFLTGFTALREHLLKTFDLRVLGDVDRGAFEEIPDEVVATTMSIFWRSPPAVERSVALQPTPLSDRTRDSARTSRKRAALLLQCGRYEYSTRTFAAVPLSPVLYWWSAEFVQRYARAKKLGEVSPGRAAQSTGDNTRFVRAPWEVAHRGYVRVDELRPRNEYLERWHPFVNGAAGTSWVEPLREIVNWRLLGLEIKLLKSAQQGREAFVLASEEFFFEPGIAFTMIGSEFSGRAHRYRSVTGDKGSSVFPGPEATDSLVCLMNTSVAKFVLGSLNPTVSFQVGDVNRLPLFEVSAVPVVSAVLKAEFEKHEHARETSVEFCRPAPSGWEHAQKWARGAVDQSTPTSMPEFKSDYVQPDVTTLLSFELGVSLGRFGSKGEGVALPNATGGLPDGLLFLSPRPEAGSLGRRECASLRALWAEHGEGLLDDWLKKEFWVFHRSLYENRPIYFPLSSVRRSFVAYVSIHRWSPTTLTRLLSDHLVPERKALEGELADLRAARASADKKSRSEMDNQFTERSKWLEELEDFISKVAECAEKGPPPSDSSTPQRETDAAYVMDLDDGVMVNAAALWPLLEPMWKEPKKWWKDLASARGGKHYDWAHLSARYFPSRVDEKCQKDPSLSVAHGCFWKYHPEKAYQWELRLQDDLGPDFLITEKDADERRKSFLKKESKLAAELQAAEEVRRERKANKQTQEALALESAEDTDDEGEAA